MPSMKSAGCGSKGRVSATFCSIPPPIADRGPSGPVRAVFGSKMGQALLGWGLSPPEASPQDIGGEGPPAEAEGQRQGEHEAPERDSERNEHHLLPDPQVGEGRRAREQEHTPVGRPGQEPRFRDPCVHRGDQQALAEKVGDQPSHGEDQNGREERREKGHQKRRRTRGAREGQGIDSDTGEHDEDAPEGHEPDDFGWWPQDPRLPQGRGDAPALEVPIDSESAGQAGNDRADDPADQEPEHEQGKEDQRGRDKGGQAIAHDDQRRPEALSEPLVHGGIPFRPISRLQFPAMRIRDVLIPIALGAVLTACGGGDSREWMKLNEKYTTEDFRRDYAECSKSGKLDEDCMRGRGWVDVSSTSKAEAPKASTPPPSPKRGY